MYILVVDGFDGNKKGRGEYIIFKELIVQTLKECEVTDSILMERKINRLGDLVVDWQHDNLNDTSRDNCKHFDKIDFVFISGDMHTCPWEPTSSQVVTLIHMCKFMNKPVFCSGYGAYTAIYSMATKGSRFHVLNGPIGDEIEYLPSFPRYSIGSGAFPSGWLDNETGDLYTYNRQNMCWEPVCNLGIYRIAANGTPSSNRHAPLLKKYAREDHLLDIRQIVEPLDVDASVTRIRSAHIQHYAVRGFEAQNCVMKSYPHWFIRSDNSLPSGENLQVIAEDEKGAVLLTKDNMIVLSSKMDKSVSFTYCRIIMVNFVNKIMSQIRSANRDKLENSMLEFLFGKHGMGVGSYDSIRAVQPMSPPLSRTAVRTALPEGPIKVDPPVIGMFLYTPKQDNVDYLALTAKRRSSTMGRSPAIRVQNPLHSRQKRMLLLTTKLTGGQPSAQSGSGTGSGNGLTGMMTLPIGVVQPTQDDSEGVPEQVKELFTGIVMNNKSISQRRVVRSPVKEYTDPPSLERLLADALEAPSTDYDRDAENYDLEEHMQPFGESWVIPGRSRSPTTRTRTPQSRGFGLDDCVDEEELADIMLNYTGFHLSGENSPQVIRAGGMLDHSLTSSITANNTPFAAPTGEKSGVRTVSPFSGEAKSATNPQQPATPRSSASAARMASRINKEFHERGVRAAAGMPPTLSAEVVAQMAREAYDCDSSEEDTPPPANPHQTHDSMRAVSMDSMDNNSAWSSQISAKKVPPVITNWYRVAQGGHSPRSERQIASQSARSYGRNGQYFDTHSSERRGFNPNGGSTFTTSQILQTSSLLVPTLSSLHRSTLTSEVGRVDPVAPPPLLPQTARTARDIDKIQKTLYLPKQHPPGPLILQRSHRCDDDADADKEYSDGEREYEEGNREESVGIDRNTMTLLRRQGTYESASAAEPECDRDLDFSSYSRTSTLVKHHTEYRHSSAVPVVQLPSRIHAERPYSSYRKITKQLREHRDAEQNGEYQGAFVHEFRHPDEQQRKEYIKSREKFLAGQFKTSFGPANTALPVRPEGGVRAEGQFPLEPPGSVTFRPDNTTAIHFASMPRSTQPLLNGAWKC